MRMKNILLLCSILPVFCLLGCNDPHSQKRIQMRVAHQREFIADSEKSMRTHQRRCREAEETVREWHRKRLERWNRIAPTVGDYVY